MVLPRTRLRCCVLRHPREWCSRDLKAVLFDCGWSKWNPPSPPLMVHVLLSSFGWNKRRVSIATECTLSVSFGWSVPLYAASSCMIDVWRTRCSWICTNVDQPSLACTRLHVIHMQRWTVGSVVNTGQSHIRGCIKTSLLG